MSYRPHPTKNKGLPPDYIGPKWWYISYYPDGKKGGVANIPRFGTESEISAIDKELRKQARKTPITVNPRFEEVLPDFVEHYKIERLPRSVERMLLSLKHLQSFLGRMALNSIGPKIVEQYKRKRTQDGLKPITINKELNVLSLVLKWAKKEELISEPAKVELYPGKLTKSPIPIVPAGEELEAVVWQIRWQVRGIAMLEFYAGLRRNEALHLQAEDLLLDRGLIIITGKGNKQRIFPVKYQPLLDELKRKQEEVQTGYLWVSPFTGKPYRDIKDSLKAAAERAGLKGRMYNHLLRHGFGTTATESGIDLRTVQTLMGHSSSRTTEIYTHIAANHLKAQMEKFNTVVNSETGKTTDDKVAAEK